MLRAHAALVACLISALPAAAARAQEDERARRVYDIFKTHCLECHGESRKGGLDLRTHETLDQRRDERSRRRPARAGREPPVPAVSHADPAR